jgi:hypothetical protein
MRRLLVVALLLLVGACSQDCDGSCAGPTLDVSATAVDGATLRACVGDRCQIRTIHAAGLPSDRSGRSRFGFDVHQLGLRPESETVEVIPGIGPTTPFRARDGFVVRLTMIGAGGSQIADATVHADHRRSECCGDFWSARL